MGPYPSLWGLLLYSEPPRSKGLVASMLRRALLFLLGRERNAWYQERFILNAIQPTDSRSAGYGPNIALCCWRNYPVSILGRYVRCAVPPPLSHLKAMAGLVPQRARPLK